MKGILRVFFIVFRAVLGIGIILAVNNIMNERNVMISIGTGVFAALTSGILGLPGVCALYGMALYHIL